jgi:hypothetical protein
VKSLGLLGTGKIKVPSGLRTHGKPPRPKAKAELSRESISLPVGKPAPGKEMLLDWQPWKAMERNRTAQALFY